MCISFGCAKPAPAVKAVADRWHCPMHTDYIKDGPGTCPLCNMDLVPIAPADASCDGSIAIDPSITRNMGIRTETATMRSLSLPVRAGAIIAADEGRIVTVTLKAEGWIERLDASRSGILIARGDHLFAVYSPELIATQDEYLSSLAYAEKLEAAGGAAETIATARELAASTRTKLTWLDMTQEHLDALEKRRSTERLVDVHSPAEGLILEKNVSTGSRLEKGAVLYRIADLSYVWAEAAVYAGDAGAVGVGSTATVTFPALPGKAFSGSVVSLDPEADPANRSLRARISIANTADRSLRPGMAAIVEIAPMRPAPCLSVSAEAVIHTGARSLVIRALGNGRFAPQAVITGKADAASVEIIAGLAAGDSVVSSGQFLIDSESRLQAALAGFDAAPPIAAVPPSPAPRPTPMTMEKKAEKKPELWICPMDPEIKEDHPGSCPICHMDLELKKD